MFRYVTLVVCLVAGCTLKEPVEQVAPPGPEDLSTWGTPELVLTQPVQRKPHPTARLEPKPGPAEKVYPFVAGSTYTVPVGLGAPLDIQFMPGESVYNAIDGDRRPIVEGQEASGGQRTCQRWCLEQGSSGVGNEKRGHIFVTVTEAGLKNGLTITTTRGTYAITLESVKQSPIRHLRWAAVPTNIEPVEEEPAVVGPLPDTTKPSRWRVGYTIAAQGRTPEWMPVGAWDDGKKIYVLLPKTTLYGTSPLVRKIGPNGPAVLNGRQYLNVLIVDELAGILELRVGTGETAEVVRITRGALRIIECPAEGTACPVWPTIAYRGQGDHS